jgi:hypothetical protein
MTPEAKSTLSKTIKGLRTRLIDDLAQATRRRYRLQVRPRESGLDERRLAERARLEDWLAEQVRAHQNAGKSGKSGKKDKRDEASFLHDAIKEAAYTLLNRVVLLRLMEEADLVGPPVVNGGWDSKGYKEFTEWAPALLDDETQGYQTLLNLVFDELAHDLPGLYGKVGLSELIPVPPATLRELIEQLDQPELDSCWSDDTTFGWVYQYWNDPEREELDAKLNARGKIEPHEVASKTQLFTERYMVEWLLQNSLGPIWLDICDRQGWTPEVVEHGVLDVLEERRKDWREKRESGEVELDDLMPIHSDLEDRWKYYLPKTKKNEDGEDIPPLTRGGGREALGGEAPAGEAPQNETLTTLRDIKLVDPACGSGHFLVIAFDLLFALYQEEARHVGETWTDAQITAWIIEHNLHGIDIDRRAIQIAAAALYLKARIQTPDYRPHTLNLVAPDLSLANLPDDDPALVELREAVERDIGIPGELVDTILASLQQAYHLGSLLKLDDEIDAALNDFEAATQTDLFTNTQGQPSPDPVEVPRSGGGGATTTNHPTSGIDETSDARIALLDALERFLAHHTNADDLGMRLHGEQLASGIRFVRINQEARYDLVVANPPYLGSGNMRERTYIKEHYPRGKADLYAAFLERGLQLAKEGGLSAMVTMRNWMFIKTYKDLRKHLIHNFDLRALGDLGSGAFEEIGGHVVSSNLSIIGRAESADEKSVAVNLTDEDTSKANRTAIKRSALLSQVGRHEFSAQALGGIEGQPLVYWWDEEFLKDYLDAPKLAETYPANEGITTGDNSRFTRLWWENDAVPGDNSHSATARWAPLISGAAGRKWFHPYDQVIAWSSNGIEVKVVNQVQYGSVSKQIRNESSYFQEGIAFTTIGDSFAARAFRWPSIFDATGRSLFPERPAAILCAMNSSAARATLQSLNPTIHFTTGDVNRLALFPVESSDDIFARIDKAFTEHEAAREASVEFKKPGPSCWEYAQEWAQKAVDRAEGEPLPEWQPEYDDAPPANWLSWAVGVALGRFDEAGEQGWLDQAPDGALDAGILYVSATDGDDSLTHRATDLLHEMWETYGDEVGRNKDDLNSWMREKFFKSVHRKMYDNAPIYVPLSSTDKTFVAHINIHRWDEHTLRRLLADHLIPERNRLDGLLADLNASRASEDTDTRRRAEDKYADVNGWVDELDAFIADVEQCAEKGPPPVGGKSAGESCPAREVDARYVPDLDDGTMINTAALWPLLDPQWKRPRKKWKRLANQKGFRGKHFDWSTLAARYWPTRVDQKCQQDPSLAVAHGTFWKYHPERAYEWELRLQDEIHPNFTIDEEGSDSADSDKLRQAFFDAHPDKVEDIRADEYKRRDRNADGEADILPVAAPEEHPTSADMVPDPENPKGEGATQESQADGVPAE